MWTWHFQCLDSNKNEFQIELKYTDGEPVIKSISRVSKPGRRVYSKIKDLQRLAKKNRNFDFIPGDVSNPKDAKKIQ